MQTHSSPGQPSFKELELAGWTSKAAAYEQWFAPITRKAISPLLRAVGPQIKGWRLLDICTGTGHVAGAAARLGAEVTGVDFALAMLEIARTNHPGATFHQADAEALPFPNASFDCAVNAFGIAHLPGPERALSEARRILRPGGRFAYTTWLSPEEGFDLSAIVNGAVREHGSMDVAIPPAPPPFRFADEAEAVRVLREIGFGTVRCERKTIIWRAMSAADVIDLIYKSIVRAPMLIEHQAPDRKERIRQAIRERAEGLRAGGVIELRFPYLLAVAENVD